MLAVFQEQAIGLRVARLRVTNYRTKFFLNQIAIGNWDLNLPITVHGFKLANLGMEVAETEKRSGDGISELEAETTAESHSVLESAAEVTASAAAKFDRVDGVITAVATRSDAVKSLWTTVGGTLSQVVWGVLGFVVGLPRIVWVTVAIIAASLTLLYLYRQIVLGRIRETRSN